MTEPAGLLDTSVFIANETGRPLNELPTRVRVSVVTIGELQLGVLATNDRAIRAETREYARPRSPSGPHLDQRSRNGHLGAPRR